MPGKAPIMSDTQFENLFQAVGEGENGLRDQAMISIAYYQGLRAGEISAMKISSILNDDGAFKERMWVAPQKTKNGRNLPIHPRVKEVLDTYLKSFIWKTFDEPLFISRSGFQFNKATGNALYKRMFHKAGMYEYSSHSFRRSCLTKLHYKGVGIRIIQRVAGHSSIGVTAGYIEVTDLDIETAINKL